MANGFRERFEKVVMKMNDSKIKRDRRSIVGIAALAMTPVLMAQDQQSQNQKNNDQPATAQAKAAVNLLQSWTAAAEPMHIAGPIQFVGTQGLGVYLLTTPAGHILIGGGMPGSAPLIEASIRKLGYQPEDIKIL